MDMLKELHVGHPGTVRTQELAHSYLWWLNVELEIKQTVKNYGSCQQVRKPPGVASLVPLMWPSNPWYHIHINVAG